MNEEFYKQLREKVKKYSDGINPCHDIDHTDRVLALALDIGKKENADLEILKISALLHDIARKEQDDSLGKICHAKRGAELANEILKEMDYPQDKAKKIIHCIATHRFRGESIPNTTEAKILYDADKLDSIGAIGIARNFSFSGSMGSRVHVIDLDVENSEEYGKNDCGHREFLVKLIKVKDKMMTNTGKKIAKKRHDFMIEFHDRLIKEVKGII